MQSREPSQIINTGVKLDAILHSRLKNLSELTDRTPHWLMKAAISEYVEREEAKFLEMQEDMKRWEKYQDTGYAIPHGKVKAWLKNIASGKSAPEDIPCPK